MNAKVRAVLARNGGLITRPELYDCGLFPEHVQLLVRTGVLVIVRRGVYADGELWRAVDERDRHRLRTRAAVGQMTRHHVASHDSAAFEHDLELLPPSEQLVHITREGVTNAWTKAGVKHHLARFRPDQVVRVDGLEVLDLARTAVDIAREHGPPYGEIACDAVLRRGVPRADLDGATAVMEYWPHVRRSRAAVDFADPGAESLLETLARIIVAGLGLGPIVTQFPVRLADGRVRWGDLRIGCHLFEADGKVKFVPREHGGLAVDSPHQVLWAEKKRDRDLNREGLGVSHIVYADFWPPQRAAAEQRLRAEFEESVARFGTRLPEHLERNAQEVRGRRGA